MNMAKEIYYGVVARIKKGIKPRAFGNLPQHGSEQPRIHLPVVVAVPPPPRGNPVATGEELGFKDSARLCSILRMKRGHNSEGEIAMITDVIMDTVAVTADAGNNYWFEIFRPDGTRSSSMWAAHTDTVHSLTKASESFYQSIAYDGLRKEIITESGDCLGGDDGVGVWVLLNMIDAGVPGRYAFFRGEEKGRIGSKNALASRDSDLVVKQMLDGVKRVVCFDRRSNCSIITHQSGSRTCSDAFADEFVTMSGLPIKKDTGGSYTDSYSFMGIIPECTNISAGFYNEHTAREYVDVKYITLLCATMVDRNMDWDSLVVSRDPTVIESKYPSYSGHSGYGSAYDLDYADWGRSGSSYRHSRKMHARTEDNLTAIEAKYLVEHYPSMAIKFLSGREMPFMDERDFIDFAYADSEIAPHIDNTLPRIGVLTYSEKRSRIRNVLKKEKLAPVNTGNELTVTSLLTAEEAEKQITAKEAHAATVGEDVICH